MIASLLKPKKKSLVDILQEKSPFAQNGQAAPAFANGAKPHKASSGPRVEDGRVSGRRSPQNDAIARVVEQMQQEVIQPLRAEMTTLYKAAQIEAAPWINKMGVQLMVIDEQWQQIVQHYIDPLLGGALRSQQLTELDIRLSEPEKDMNRRVLLAAGNLGIAWGATYLFPPLAIANIVFSTWLAWQPLYKRGYHLLVEKHRLSFPVVLFSSSVAAYFGGFFIPASVGLLMVMSTQKVMAHTEDHFRRGFVGAFGTQPRTVWVIIEGSEVEVPFITIKHGDILVLEAGQTVPVDGVITAGMATIDQHMLTGESQPAEKGVGDRVLAATLLLAGKLQVQVEKTGVETNAAEIASVLQNAAKYKISFASRIQDFNDQLVIPLLAVGGLSWLVLGPWAAAAIMSMGIGAMARVAGPLSMLSYMNVASRRGILIKDARALEVFKNVDTIVFDKTGTLTLEQPQVYGIHLCSVLDEATLLTYAAAAEVKQTHPIARAILAAATTRGLVLPTLDDAHYEAGFGIKVQVNQQSVWVGSWRFMEIEQLPVPAALNAAQAACHAKGHSLVLVAVGEQVVGAIELAPTIRLEAKQAVAELQAQGLTIYIISGDHEAPTRHLAQELGITHYYAGVLPKDKAALVEGLKADGRTVCFVGDGINDAIALSKADVSVSLRGATTIATDTAQIVLMSQDLSHLVFLREIARNFEGTMNTLFRLTLLPMALVIGTTFLLHTGIYFSILIRNIGIGSGVVLALLPLRNDNQE